MDISTYISSPEDITRARQAGITEALVAPSAISIRGRLSVEDVNSLGASIREAGLTPVLLWDILIPEHLFLECTQVVHSIDTTIYQSFRVRDPGAAGWLVENCPDHHIQLICEDSNHNLPSLLSWTKLYGDRLEKIVLSTQLPEEKLKEYIEKLPVTCEVAGAAPILLFYSPRPLLSSLYDDTSDDEIEVLVTSEDVSGRTLKSVETRHGTLLYLDKDHFILDKLIGIMEAGIGSVRIDMRHDATPPHSTTDRLKALIEQINTKEAKALWPRTTAAPFFKSNKTTAQFRRLKSHLHGLRTEACIAKVLSIETDKRVIFTALNSTILPINAVLHLPTGQTREISLPVITDTSGSPVTHLIEDCIYVSLPIKNASAGTLVMRGESEE